MFTVWEEHLLPDHHASRPPLRPAVQPPPTRRGDRPRVRLRTAEAKRDLDTAAVAEALACIPHTDSPPATRKGQDCVQRHSFELRTALAGVRGGAQARRHHYHRLPGPRELPPVGTRLEKARPSAHLVHAQSLDLRADSRNTAAAQATGSCRVLCGWRVDVSL